MANSIHDSNGFIEAPKANMPIEGVPSSLVETMMRKDMDKDTPPSQDFGRFSTTEFDDSVKRLLHLANLRNTACVEEYPSVGKFQDRCISTLADLWNTPPDCNSFGTGTTGSSEAVMLGGLAMKNKWQLENKSKTGKRPNVIIGENAHICVKKFADYFDVEARVIPTPKEKYYSMSPERIRENINENTIGVFLTLGSTYTGHYDPIEQISQILDDYEHNTGINIPIHVDAASGGFVAPFTSSNSAFVWDFRLPRVKSINSSGHKYGQSLLAVGWIVWREKEWIPKGLLLESSYLRGTQTAYTLSFSRSSAPIVAQYYQFYQQGMSGYRARIGRYLGIAKALSLELENSGYFTCLSPVHLPYKVRDQSKISSCRNGCYMTAPGIPIVVFALSNDAKKRHPDLDLSTLSDSLHEMKLSIPHYTIRGWGDDGSDIDVMRIVVREELKVPLMHKIMSAILECVNTMVKR